METESFKIAQERLIDRKRAIKRGENPYAETKPAADDPPPAQAGAAAPSAPTAPRRPHPKTQGSVERS